MNIPKILHNHFKKNSFCRVCLKNLGKRFELIDEIFKDMLDVFLLNMNFSLAENLLVCKKCVYSIRALFHFKSKCIESEKCLLDFYRGKNQAYIFLKDFYEELNVDKVDETNYAICRLCIKQIAKSNFYPLDVLIEEDIFSKMLTQCMPELDFTLVKAPLVCMHCKNQLERYFKFILNCLNTEQTIITCTNTETVNDISYKKHSTNENTQVFNTANCDSKTLYQLVDSNATNTKAYKCLLCDFQTGYSYSIKRHILKHMDPSEKNVTMYKCSFCEYQSKLKCNLKTHLLTHMDSSEVQTYSCPQCPYSTKHKPSLKTHMVSHKSTSEVEMHSCEQCEYETKYKRCLRVHMLTHKDQSEVEMLKCTLCSYKTPHEMYLKRHISSHFKVKAKTETYRCTRCPFKTGAKRNLARHLLRHDKQQLETYRCEECGFETKYGHSIKRHILLHKRSK